ncbi:3-oxoacid CoA-transferase subunit B [Lichenicoccus sp.]|uniref:3-oxoacid CoA-transferase subunit B n=1 Tax=Lichenicoccus sp. TaxID=2781899 RepID=UPI003D104060
MTEFTPMSRKQMAARLAQDIPDGSTVNLGIGIPTLVADYIPEGREVMLHSENGILGMGPAPAPDAINPWLINAGKQHVTLLKGGSFFHQADSFAIIRGGHLDLCVLGAFEVAQNGDLANWATLDANMPPAVGGAMDLALGAKRSWVITEHTTREGAPKLVEHCAYPLTALGAVQRIYTNLAVIDVTERGFVLRDRVPGLSLEALQARTGAKLHIEEHADA